MPQIEEQGENIIVRGVPIFDEHTSESKDENRPKKVDSRYLGEVIAATNKRMFDTEGELPLALGVHTPKEGETHAPPPVVGGYRNLRLGTIGNVTPRKAILADFRIPKDNWQFCQHYQRRSVELFPSTRELDTIILLGSKAPARDLGPMTSAAQYSRADGKGAAVRYEMSTDGEDSMDGMEQAPQSKLSTEDLQMISEMMKTAIKDALQEMLGDDEPAPEEEMPMEPDGDEMSTDMSEDVPTEPVAEDMPMDRDEEKEEYDRVRERSARSAIARYEKELAAERAKREKLEKRIDQAEHKERMARYERELADLENTGYMFKRDEKLQEIMALPSDKLRDSAISDIRKHYKRQPIGGYTGPNGLQYGRGEDPVTYGESGDGKVLTKTQAEAVAKYTREHKCSWEVARTAVLSAK